MGSPFLRIFFVDSMEWGIHHVGRDCVQSGTHFDAPGELVIAPRIRKRSQHTPTLARDYMQ